MPVLLEVDDRSVFLREFGAMVINAYEETMDYRDQTYHKGH
jgi:hypothetical protein